MMVSASAVCRALIAPPLMPATTSVSEFVFLLLFLLLLLLVFKLFKDNPPNPFLLRDR